MSFCSLHIQTFLPGIISAGEISKRKSFLSDVDQTSLTLAQRERSGLVCLFVELFERPTRLQEVAFVSNVFLRPKNNGKFRMIIDLSDLNHHLRKTHFKTDHLESAHELVHPGSFFAFVVLRDAYYSVPFGNHTRDFSPSNGRVYSSSSKCCLLG